ncbi:molecular chaperone GroEL [Caproicibacter sp.]|uniref:molecular chaperone GroEL n=1 Tax=Caproicibacter sp. TaxID=2814884 RepID=UPI00398983AD
MLIDGVIVFMTEIDPKMKDRFNSLSEGLKSEIMKQNVQIRSLQDLIHCLEKIVKEG